MNPGNTKRKNPQKVDILVERLNKRIGRILGKKGKLPPQKKKTSNLTFSILILSFTVMLWFTTGFYYLADNQYGLVLRNGKIVNVVKGIKVGFVAPYPFGDMEVIDASVSDFIDLDKTSLNNGNFNIISADLNPIKVDAKFNYQVVDPVLMFKTSLQKQANLDNLIAWNVQIELHDYFVQKTKNEILKSNLTVVANEVKNAVNEKISKTGIKIIKLNITALNEVVSINASSVGNVVPIIAATPKPISQQLLDQAQQYKENILAQTQVDIDKFNQLLPQYKVNQRAIVQQMYYDTLEAIPTKQLLNNYPLISLNLSDLILLSQQQQATPLINSTASAPALRERHFSREVNRDAGRSFSDMGAQQ